MSITQVNGSAVTTNSTNNNGGAGINVGSSNNLANKSSGQNTDRVGSIVSNTSDIDPALTDGIFAFNNDELYRVSSDIAITKYSTDGILPEVLLMSNDTLVVSAAFGHTISLFAVSSMGESKDLNFGINDTEMIWFSTVTKSNYVWISSSLKGIWLCNKLNRQKRLVLFDQDFLDAPRQSPPEDNINGIRVVSESDTIFYFVIMRNNNIQLYKVSI